MSLSHARASSSVLCQSMQAMCTVVWRDIRQRYHIHPRHSAALCPALPSSHARSDCTACAASRHLHFASVQAWPTSKRCSWIESCVQLGLVRTAMLAEARAADVDAKRARGGGGRRGGI